MTTYVTKSGDTVDLIVYKYYGKQTGRLTERLLEANTGLADFGPLLPAGLLISLPDIAPDPVNTGVKLWD